MVTPGMVSPDDPGAANERTALSWQRTALAMLVGSAIIARLTVDRLGLLAVSGLLITTALAAWVLLEHRNRYQRNIGLQPQRRPNGGRSAGALAAGVIIVAALEAAALLGGR